MIKISTEYFNHAGETPKEPLKLEVVTVNKHKGSFLLMLMFNKKVRLKSMGSSEDEDNVTVESQRDENEWLTVNYTKPLKNAFFSYNENNYELYLVYSPWKLLSSKVIQIEKF